MNLYTNSQDDTSNWLRSNHYVRMNREGLSSIDPHNLFHQQPKIELSLCAA
jgi:hypothetical protein